MLESVVAWAEALRLPQALARSAVLTGVLSGLHLVGLTLIVGGALMAGLRGARGMFAARPLRETIGPFTAAISAGLCLSVATGLLLVAWRLGAALENGFFQLKMLLLLGAAVFHLAVLRPAARAAEPGPLRFRAIVRTALGLWLAVALAGSAFILLE